MTSKTISAEALTRSYDTPFATGNVPEDLRAYPQWMLWRPERSGERVNKAPRRALDGRKASKTDPENYSTFTEAVAEAHRLSVPGIGICLTNGDPLVALDLDGCIDAVTGEIEAAASGMMESLDSYAELSPSRRGIRIFCYGSLPRNVKTSEIEMYDRGAFLTVTGDVLRSGGLRDAQTALDALVAQHTRDTSQDVHRERRPYTGPPGEKLDLREFLEASGVVILGEILDGSAERVFKIVCPWLSEHSHGDRSGTRVGQYPDGATFFRCEHSHCGGRGWPEFRREVNPEPIRIGRVYVRRRKEVSLG